MAAEAASAGAERSVESRLAIVVWDMMGWKEERFEECKRRARVMQRDRI